MQFLLAPLLVVNVEASPQFLLAGGQRQLPLEHIHYTADVGSQTKGPMSRLYAYDAPAGPLL